MMSRAVAAKTPTAPSAQELGYNEAEGNGNSAIRYDDSCTVTELKGAAKEKGIAGYSSMNKAKLLEVLNSD